MSRVRTNDPAEIAKLREVCKRSAARMKDTFHFLGSGHFTVGYVFDDAVVSLNIRAADITERTIPELEEWLYNEIRANVGLVP